MKRIEKGLSAAIIGVATLLILSGNAIALMADQIDRLSRRITVRIDGINPGSGAIIAREGNIYYVLTANHVVRSPDEYTIVTDGGERYPLDYDRVIKLPGIDLALLQFESDRTYPVAEIADYNYDADSRHIFISGWPESQERRFTAGLLVGEAYKLAFVKEPFSRGYDLFYTNLTGLGMSGAPIFDTEGRVIGIHGMTEGQILYDEMTRMNDRVLVGYSAGIPMQRFLQSGIRLDLNVSRGEPPSPTAEELQAISRYLQVPEVADRFSAVDWTNRGNQLYRLERWREALEAFERAIALQEDFYPAWYGRGNALSSLGRYDEAIRSYDRATQLRPNFYPAWRDRGAVLMSLNRTDEALQAFDRLIQIKPDDYAIWYLRGNLLMDRRQNYQKAVESYDRAIAVKPDFIPALTARGEALFRLGNYGAAIVSVEDILDLDPELGEVWVLKGAILMELRRYGEALDAYSRAIEIDSNNARGWFGKAMALTRLNRDREARTAAMQALRINPGDRDIIEFLRRFREPDTDSVHR